MPVYHIRKVVEAYVDAKTAEDAIHAVQVETKSSIFSNVDVKRQPAVTIIEAKLEE